MAIIILIAVPKIIQRVMFGESKSNIANAMTNLVNETNKDLPKQIDSVTTLTKAEFNTTTFMYRIHYTMKPGYNIKKEELNIIQENAIAQICGGNMKLILDKNITIEYSYTFNPDGAADRETRFTIPPTSCK